MCSAPIYYHVPFILYLSYFAFPCCLCRLTRSVLCDMFCYVWWYRSHNMSVTAVGWDRMLLIFHDFVYSLMSDDNFRWLVNTICIIRTRWFVSDRNGRVPDSRPWIRLFRYSGSQPPVHVNLNVDAPIILYLRVSIARSCTLAPSITEKKHQVLNWSRSVELIFCMVS